MRAAPANMRQCGRVSTPRARRITPQGGRDGRPRCTRATWEPVALFDKGPTTRERSRGGSVDRDGASRRSGDSLLVVAARSIPGTDSFWAAVAAADALSPPASRGSHHSARRLASARLSSLMNARRSDMAPMASSKARAAGRGVESGSTETRKGPLTALQRARGISRAQ